MSVRLTMHATPQRSDLYPGVLRVEARDGVLFLHDIHGYAAWPLQRVKEIALDDDGGALMPATLLGQTREQWALQAAKALVASMDRELLVLVVRLGFRRFAPLARREFRREDPRIVFTNHELRLMFEYLQQTLPWRVV